MLHFQRELNCNTDYDVIVVGGGPAGCAAAISASREGLKTLLVERTGALGGLGTNGLVPFWCGFYNGGNLCCTGIGKQVLLETCKRMDTQLYQDVLQGLTNPKQLPWRIGIDAHILQCVYDDFVTQHGVHTLFNTLLCSVNATEGKVENIILANKEGLCAYQAKMYIDCTGDADLVAWAGGEVLQGDDQGKTQSATLCFTVANVNMEEYFKQNRYAIYPHNNDTYSLIIDNFCTTAIVGKNQIGFNACHLPNVDGTNAQDVSDNLQKGRKLANQLLQRLQELYPQIYGNSFIANTGSLLGIRESRRIVGDYTLTTEDYLLRRTFPDEIARNCYELDSHEAGNNLKYEVVYKAGESHGIPYGCLTPKNLTNVLVAGKCISADRTTLSAIRVMANCLSTGEAAGIASAHCIQNQVDIHHVDIQPIRKRLQSVGAFIL